MATITGSYLPAPKSWEAFEDICVDSFGQRWSNPNLSRHGRSGQAQQGVDIYGEDDKGNFVGIQCKNTIGGISKALVDREVEVAEAFTPAITTLYIATTCEADAPLQKHVRTLSTTRAQQGKFKVEIVFWQAIVQDLCNSPTQAAKHFPQFNISSAVSGNPSRPRNLASLTRLLEVIDFDSVNSYLDWGPKYVHSSIIDHVAEIDDVLNSPTFVIGDEPLMAAVNRLAKAWAELRTWIGQGPYELHPNGMLVFRMFGDTIQAPEEQAVYDRVQDLLQALRRELHAFSQYVHSQYSEIDLVATSRNARIFYYA